MQSKLKLGRKGLRDEKKYNLCEQVNSLKFRIWLYSILYWALKGIFLRLNTLGWVL